MNIAVAQVNPRVGDVGANLALARRAVACAERQGAGLVVLPELMLAGYPPRDLLYERGFVGQVMAATQELARDTERGPAVVVGTLSEGAPTPGHPGLHNTAAVLRGGAVVAEFAKQLLPAYDVYHEPRWFIPGAPRGPVDVGGLRLGVLICEDMWDEDYPVHPVQALADADLLVCISASPYRLGVRDRRLHHARRASRPLVYANLVGGQDEMIFDGASFAVDGNGVVTDRLPSFQEEVRVVRLEGAHRLDAPADGELFDALVLGVRDFVRKNGIRRVYLGLSGGIDSALVACVAAQAVGPSFVTGVALPSRFTDPRSTQVARELAEELGIDFREIPIEGPHAALERLLGETCSGVTDENVQARVRATILMALVNRHGGLLLNTSNKTELSLGYGTLYGDMAGALSVIGDLTKTQVYDVARAYVRRGGRIPQFILERPPSAELRPAQVDPFDYPVVSPQVEAMVAGEAAGPAELQRLLRLSEHKRWQAPIVLKVSERAFGTGRMMPVTHARKGDENDAARRSAAGALDATAALRQPDHCRAAV